MSQYNAYHTMNPAHSLNSGLLFRPHGESSEGGTAGNTSVPNYTHANNANHHSAMHMNSRTDLSHINTNFHASNASNNILDPPFNFDGVTNVHWNQQDLESMAPYNFNSTPLDTPSIFVDSSPPPPRIPLTSMGSHPSPHSPYGFLSYHSPTSGSYPPSPSGSSVDHSVSPYTIPQPLTPSSAMAMRDSPSPYIMSSNTLSVHPADPTIAMTNQLFAMPEDAQVFHELAPNRSPRSPLAPNINRCNPVAPMPIMDSTALGPYIPQKKYQPHTKSDYRRYVDEITLDPPIKFTLQNPNQGGIPLRDALTSRFMRLVGRDDLMFVQRGPSISIRLEWQGYQSWSRQIPTRDFRNPPGPITRAKLAKNVAKSVDRFISEHKDLQLERGADPKWRVGPGYIDIDNLILVELQHVSMGSWQAHLRLAHPIHPSHPMTS